MIRALDISPIEYPDISYSFRDTHKYILAMFENAVPIQLNLLAQRRLRNAAYLPQSGTSAANSTIIDIRPHPEKTDDTLRESIQESLDKITSDQGNEAGVGMPSLLLWDQQGLRYFEDVTYSSSYYLTNEEIGLLEKNKYKIAERIESGSMLVELGSGYVIAYFTNSSYRELMK